MTNDQAVVDCMVKYEKEVLRLKDENRELKEKNASYLRLIDLDTKRIIEWGDKAGAWDDLEALVSNLKGRIVITPNSDPYWCRFIVEDTSLTNLYSSKEFSKEAVSNALESIKRES